MLTISTSQWVSGILTSSEAYFTDPEGNGIEVYYDRPSEDWLWRDGFVKMDTLEVDVNDLMTQRSNEGWQSWPEEGKNRAFTSQNTQFRICL